MANRVLRLELHPKTGDDEANVEVVVAAVRTEQDELRITEEGRVGDEGKATRMAISVPEDKLNRDFDFNALQIPAKRGDHIKVVNPIQEGEVIQAVEQLLGAEKERVVASFLGAQAVSICREEVERIAGDNESPYQYRAVLVRTVIRRALAVINFKDSAIQSY